MRCAASSPIRTCAASSSPSPDRRSGTTHSRWRSRSSPSTTEGVAAVGIVTAVRQAAAATIAPFAASLADRFRRERVMLASDAGRIACSAGIAVLVSSGSPTIAVYALAVGASVSGAVFRPAEASLVPLVARSPQELTAANVAASTFDSVGVFAGPALGAFLIAVLGLHGVLRRGRGDVRVERALRRADLLRHARCSLPRPRPRTATAKRAACARCSQASARSPTSRACDS